MSRVRATVLDMDVLEYLMQGDPAIRWQVMRDLADESPDAVAAERARVATDGWGATLLGLQGDDGAWDGGTYRPAWAEEFPGFFDAWSATHFSLQSLMQFGADPSSPDVSAALDRVAQNVRWEYNGELYFQGEIEPCINGVALSIGAYFGRDAAPIADTLLQTQLDDGGWNCWAPEEASTSSAHSTICALEGLRDWEAATGGSPAVREARLRGEEYLLDRRLLYRVSTGEVMDPRFAMPSYPDRWYYDIVRALDYFRLARPEGDARCADAIALLREKMLPFGMWALENHHQGPTRLQMEAEGEGAPSRWITLRALRILRWADAAA
jgi:hypothetical protein